MSLLDALRPDVLVKGANYTAEEVVGGDLVRSYGGQVVLAKVAAPVHPVCAHKPAPRTRVSRAMPVMMPTPISAQMPRSVWAAMPLRASAAVAAANQRARAGPPVLRTPAQPSEPRNPCRNKRCAEPGGGAPRAGLHWSGRQPGRCAVQHDGGFAGLGRAARHPGGGHVLGL